MAKKSSRYICANCGAQSSSWAGKCAVCAEWNTLQETIEIDTSSPVVGGNVLNAAALQTLVTTDKPRIGTSIDEIDTVMGGGIVRGSVNLIAGQPGIGKSTILLQIAHGVSKEHRVLYVSGEESEHQIGIRAERLGANNTSLKLATSTIADDVAATIESQSYDLVIVDSIQTLTCRSLNSAAGTVTQITNSAQLLTAAAKRSNTAIIIVGHVTKEGSIAGPKVLEHVVDVVLQLEGDRYGGFKILRSTKNRFGSTHEVGIFEMHNEGLRVVANPSAALLEERHVTDGSVVLATVEGTRALLVEVQALVNTTSYGYPKRAASGIDLNRLNLLIAVLEKRTKLKLADKDIYVNIVGGMKITETAADLAICLAIGSAAKGMKLVSNAVVFGEVGLSGEVRHVPYVEKRIAEADKLGFDIAIGPRVKGMHANSKLKVVADVRSALNSFLDK